jgi:hypothetical protein
MKILYLLNLVDEETGEEIGVIEAYSQESLQEQFLKADEMIDRYQEQDRSWQEIDLNEWAEQHND